MNWQRLKDTAFFMLAVEGTTEEDSKEFQASSFTRKSPSVTAKGVCGALVQRGLADSHC